MWRTSQLIWFIYTHQDYFTEAWNFEDIDDIDMNLHIIYSYVVCLNISRHHLCMSTTCELSDYKKERKCKTSRFLNVFTLRALRRHDPIFWKGWTKRAMHKSMAHVADLPSLQKCDVWSDDMQISCTGIFMYTIYQYTSIYNIYIYIYLGYWCHIIW